MFQRRDVLKAALGVVAAGFEPAASFAQGEGPAPTPAEPPPVSRDAVLELARALAKKPFAPPNAELRDPFAGIAYDQYVAIKPKPGAAIWAKDGVGFSIEPLHRGPIFSTQVDLYVVEGRGASRIAYDQSKFDYGALKIADKLSDMGFSGFRVLRAQEGAPDAEVALFQGASFYRAVTPGQSLGVTARGLSIRTADPRGEEFPIFRSFWIEKPALGDNALTVHALLDSQSVTGAYRFTLRAGEATIVDVELTLIPRAPIEHFGLAGLAAASLFTPLDRRRADDIRPMVAEVNGLQMLTGKNEWLWRPASNRNSLQFSSFVDANPKGFGFLLRNRDIAAYQDDDQHFERRPSLWIEPLGDWGEGAMQLVEIPSESEVNGNILAYWRPKTPLAAGKEATFAYRQFWCWEPPTRPPFAVATEARAGRSPFAKLRRFIVVFTGDNLLDAQRAGPIKPALTTSPGSASNVRAIFNPQSRTCRVIFDIDAGGESFCEMRLVLQAGDDPTPISETWLYRWTS
jgi:periplasmic glucans biosynthesis protein